MLDAIEHAVDTIQIVIFRFDRGELEAALKRAVKRGVFVHALVAYTMAGQGGEARLRELELRLLAHGVTVARSASDLIRHHDKLMIVDRKALFVMCFNYTFLDIERSRSFGILTHDSVWVEEALKLFNADTTRQPYSPASDTLLVSPGNSRQQLMELIESARKQLLIYDCKLSDPDAMRLLAAKAKAGLDVRVIGSAGRRATGVRTARPHMRLHAQAIISDGSRLFLGSQSLRTQDLDARREVGILVEDPGIVGGVIATFESDWARAIEMQKPARATSVKDAVMAEYAGSCADARDSTPPPLSMQLVKSVIKEAIKDAILEAMPQSAEILPLKTAVKDAAREALSELAP